MPIKQAKVSKIEHMAEWQFSAGVPVAAFFWWLPDLIEYYPLNDNGWFEGKEFHHAGFGVFN